MYNLKDFHRPMTLVLAQERTLESIREALFANRTIAYFGNILAGKEEYLKAVFEASVQIKYYDKTEKGKSYIITNTSDVPFVVSSKEELFTIPANGETMVTLPENFKNLIEVKNLYVKGTENLKLKLNL